MKALYMFGSMLLLGVYPHIITIYHCLNHTVCNCYDNHRHVSGAATPEQSSGSPENRTFLLYLQYVTPI